jgi:hypothetical protein
MSLFLAAIPYGSEGPCESDISSVGSEIFSENESDNDCSSDLELNSEESNEDDKQDEFFDDEGQLTPEHYLAETENLDVSQLRQKRYSDTTKNRLDKTRVYWDRLIKKHLFEVLYIRN